MRSPRVCILGSFPARSAGGLPTQGEEMATRLERSGLTVHLTSRRDASIARLVEILLEVCFKWWKYDTFCVQVFAYRAVVLEAAAIVAGRFWRRRVVLVMRGGDLPNYMDRSILPLARLYGLADRVISPSRYLATALGERGMDVRVVPNTIPIERYQYRHRREIRPRILWMRAFHPFYNPELALRTFQRVKATFPRARLTMAGIDKGCESTMKAMVEDLGLEDITFPGAIPKSEVPSLMAAHDVYFNTPHVDNLPVSVLEALATGLIVVATRVGGVPFLLEDEKTALLVPADDDEAMAEATRRCLTDPLLAGRLSEQGRRLAEGHTWTVAEPLWIEALGGGTEAHRTREEEDVPGPGRGV